MTRFLNHFSKIMRRLNGQAAAANQHLLDVAAEASAAEGIRQGLDDINAGRSLPAHQVFNEIRAEYGIPR